MTELKEHSDEAWIIASQFSHALASDTRTLASMIDDAIKAEREACADIAENWLGAAYDNPAVEIAKEIRERN